MTKPTRYVSVDLETTSLDPWVAFPTEIAAVECLPDDSGVYGRMTTFVPAHDDAVIHAADPIALSVSRYYERRLFARRPSPEEHAWNLEQLLDLLDGATLVGANPAYDAGVLWSWLRTERPGLDVPPWHFRLFDVELATAIALGTEGIPGLAKCVDLWNLDSFSSTDRMHTAAGDAFAAADVFAAVWNHRNLGGARNGDA